MSKKCLWLHVWYGIANVPRVLFGFAEPSSAKSATVCQGVSVQKWKTDSLLRDSHQVVRASWEHSSQLERSCISLPVIRKKLAISSVFPEVPVGWFSAILASKCTDDILVKQKVSHAPTPRYAHLTSAHLVQAATMSATATAVASMSERIRCWTATP